MEVKTILHILNRYKWLILVTTFITVIVVYFGQTQIPTKYEATVVMRVLPFGSTNPGSVNLYYAERIINTYVKIAASKPIVEQMQDKLGLDETRPVGVDVNVVPNTELLQITVEDYDPRLASVAANTMAEILLNEETIQDTRVYIIEPATPPEPDYLMKTLLYIGLAVVLGLSGGIGLAFLFDNLDTRLHTTSEIAKFTGLPVIGEIPSLHRLEDGALTVDVFLLDDAYRRLRTNVLILSKDDSLRNLAVTSAEPNEGKSTIIFNLGRSIALTGLKVLLVDADLHRPTLHRFFDLPNKVGLRHVLMQQVSFREVLLTTEYPGLHLLPSGRPADNPEELLSSRQLVELLEQLKKIFDMVILDTPAFLGIADSAILAPKVDGVILVARCNTIRQAPLRITNQQLLSVRANLVGLVVNHVQAPKSRYYQKYYRQTAVRQNRFELWMRQLILKTPQPEENGRPSTVEHESKND